MTDIILYDYWRSTASYRVRIALCLKNLHFSTVSVDLLGGQQRSAQHLKRHPHGLVPAIEIDGRMLTQSLAIIQYLDAKSEQVPLLPDDPLARARVQALSYAIAMDIHPICNISVANHVVDITGGGNDAQIAWMHRFIGAGLRAFERSLDHPDTGRFCHGDMPSMADCCLIPQLYNAERWGFDFSGLDRILAIKGACAELAEFGKAHPDLFKPEPDA